MAGVAPRLSADERPARMSSLDGLDVHRRRVARRHRRHDAAGCAGARLPCRCPAARSRARRRPARRPAARSPRCPRRESTISASRRAESGSSVARSSMPSAPAELVTVNETGWASRLASAASDCAAMAWMLSPRSGPPCCSSPVGSPDQGVSSSFTLRSQAATKHRRERRHGRSPAPPRGPRPRRRPQTGSGRPRPSTSGLPWAALSSRSQQRQRMVHRPRARRPGSRRCCGTSAGPAGCEPRPPAQRKLPSSRSRKRASVRASTGSGAARSIAGSSTREVGGEALQRQRAADVRGVRRSRTVSASASAARPVP